jgi:hypothetical protein
MTILPRGGKGRLERGYALAAGWRQLAKAMATVSAEA